jgi:OOP family OmpA-OmpF porin
MRLGNKGEMLWNGGVGILLRASERVGLRADIRDLMFKIPYAADEDEWNNSLEAFVGISFNFGVGPPPDTDMDGVSDKEDNCPDTPIGARVDMAGCPTDADGDGVLDGLDGCPSTPSGATVDSRGCPTDSDNDGVYDGLDRCDRTLAGCTVDASGCPLDSDGDAVCDGLDRCPNTPRGAAIDQNGCPVLTELLDTGILRLEDVRFETGKATLLPESFVLLDEVGESVSKWPKLRLEIGGHTDASGSTKANQALSEKRAASVRDYLLNKFPSLRADQFTVVGYGESQPIDDNSTKAGMAKNRRVEFKVLNQEELKKEFGR